MLSARHRGTTAPAGLIATGLVLFGVDQAGDFNLAAASTETAFHIGTLDLKYKLDHGYVSQALNQDLLLVDDHGDPSGDGPVAKGFLYDWDAYTVEGAPAG